MVPQNVVGAGLLPTIGGAGEPVLRTGALCVGSMWVATRLQLAATELASDTSSLGDTNHTKQPRGTAAVVPVSIACASRG